MRLFSAIVTVLALMGLLLAPCAGAEVAWPANLTPGQEALREYLARLDTDLILQGEGTVNSLFECYSGFAVLGITGSDMAETPEGVELTFTLSENRVESLQLRVSDMTRFPVIAGAALQAVTDSLTAGEAQQGPRDYAQRAEKAPLTGFEEQVLTGAGEAPRVYYAYYPNQYSDGMDWLQMTLIFPLDAGVEPMVTYTPIPPDEYVLQEDGAEDGRYNNYGYSYDGSDQHFDVYISPTPEPDPFGEGN